MSSFNQIHVVDTDAFDQAYNPKVIHQFLARKWRVAMEKQIPDTMPAVVQHESDPVFEQTLQTMKQIVSETASSEKINQASDIDVHLAALFMIRHWKYRQMFAYAIGCSDRYHDVVREELAQIITSHHNVAVEQKIIHDVLVRQK